MRTIVGMKLNQVSQRLARHYGLKTTVGDGLSAALTAACLLPDTGARNVDSLLNQQILPVLSQQLLLQMAAKQKPQQLTLDWDDEEASCWNLLTQRKVNHEQKPDLFFQPQPPPAGGA